MQFMDFFKHTEITGRDNYKIYYQNVLVHKLFYKIIIIILNKCYSLKTYSDKYLDNLTQVLFSATVNNNNNKNADHSRFSRILYTIKKAQKVSTSLFNHKTNIKGDNMVITAIYQPSK